MSPRVPAVLLALLSVLAILLAGGAGAQETPANGTVAPEETVIEIGLEPDGDASWEITEQFAITDAAERAAFDDLGASIEAGASDPLGLSTYRRALSEAASGTERGMRIRNAGYGVERENASLSDVRALNGTYSLSFTWTNFAREEGDRLVVDDVFNTTEGGWLSGLTGDERLVIALPPGHGASSAPKGFEQNELRWEGPTSFEPGYLRIVYSGDIPPPNPENGASLLVWAALGVAVVALASAGVLLARRRGVDLETMIESEGETEAEAEADAAAEDDDAADDDEEDLALLSDEERVERLLEDNGGRMKQANIVQETGWSNAKVSQLLSAMEDDDQIRKLRIGRENLITFPDEDVGEFESR